MPRQKVRRRVKERVSKIICGDAAEVLKTLPQGSVNMCVTSPPYYGLRDYGEGGQIGLEQTPQEYIGRLIEVFDEVKRVLADDGTLWLNIGDTYANKPYKNVKQKTSSAYLGCSLSLSANGVGICVPILSGTRKTACRKV